MSAKPVLYYTPRSPPCRSVLLTAAELGLELDLRVMNLLAGEHKTPEFLKLNPQHTIPVLDDNGVVISDSHVICTYLADKYSKDESLFPKDLDTRNKIMARLFYNCGHLFSRVRFIVEPILYFGCPEMPKDKIEYLQKAYDGLEHCLVGNDYVCGNQMTIADLNCFPSISTAHGVAPIDEKLFPNLWAWHERMAARPSCQKWNKEGADALKAAIAEKLEANKKAH